MVRWAAPRYFRDPPLAMIRAGGGQRDPFIGRNRFIVFTVAANEALRDIIRRSGLTWDRLARAVNAVAAENGELLRTNRSSVSQWCGGKTPRPATVRYL